MDIRQKFGKNLRRERDQHSWSQEELGHVADIHRTYISDLERGARNPTIELVEKLAKALGVSMGTLLD
jgi:transcriptional regulator with XRE-family HTH domain